MEHYKNIFSALTKKNVTLVAVSKTKPISLIQDYYNIGQRIFGENRVNELVEKYNELPKDIEWHMIGHLQKNKVKYIAPFVSLIHSIDTIELAKVVNKEAKKNKRVLNVLLQIKIAKEDSKTGFDYQGLTKAIPELLEMSNINILGLMGMGTFTNDTKITKAEFDEMYRYFNKLKYNYFDTKEDFKELSMGMSGDYKIAIEEGSTMVRIGSLLFGNR